MPKKKTIAKQITVDVRTAHPLSDVQREKIGTVLQKRLNVLPELNEIVDESLLGGFQVQIGSSLIDLSTKAKMHDMKDVLLKASLKGLSADGLEENFEKLMAKQPVLPHVVNGGYVASVKDGVARVTGMKKVAAGELICFENDVNGIVFNLSESHADIVLLGKADKLKEGTFARQTGEVLKVPVGEAVLGRVVDALGRPIDEEGDIKTKTFYPIERPAVGIVDRQPVKVPLRTGTKVVDALVPIGLGQRELIVGDRQTGKTTLMVDAILNQKKLNETATDEKQKVYCIYVAIGQKQSTVADLVTLLKKKGAMAYTTVVCAGASDSASLQYIAPFTATSMGEYFRDKGKNVVIFYDDLSKHANAYRQLSLLLRRPPGREAYPGDIFYLHSRLLERAAMMSDAKGGGSLTAIPAVETQEGDLSAYIPTNVISITDGQIFLENTLFHQGIRPAVNVGLSVSRVGSKAQYPLLAKLAGSMKLELAQYREMLSFAQIASDLDASAQSLLQKGARLTQMLCQSENAPLSFAQEYVSLYAAQKGFLDSLEVADIAPFAEQLMEQMPLTYPDLMDQLEQTQKLSPAMQSVLDEALRELSTAFLAQKQKLFDEKAAS